MKNHVFVNWISNGTWEIKVCKINYSKIIPYVITTTTNYFAKPYHDEKTIIKFKNGSKNAKRKLMNFAKTYHHAKCIITQNKIYFDKKDRIYKIKKFSKETWIYR